MNLLNIKNSIYYKEYYQRLISSQGKEEFELHYLEIYNNLCVDSSTLKFSSMFKYLVLIKAKDDSSNKLGFKEKQKTL